MPIKKIKKHSVIYDKPVSQFLYHLTETLLEKDYFSFLDSALNYVEEIEEFIEQKIHILQHHPAPEYFSKYQSGMKYIVYPANKKTVWYIFFKQSGNRFLIYYITNNHFEGQYIR